jgi:hypothetical protein
MLKKKFTKSEAEEDKLASLKKLRPVDAVHEQN